MKKWFKKLNIVVPLYFSSLLRFFFLEDLMRSFGIEQMLHMEADNLLYVSLEHLIPALAKHYPNLAANPLGLEGRVVTASTFWIGNVNALAHFNDWLWKLTQDDADQREVLALVGWLAQRTPGTKQFWLRPGRQGIYPRDFDYPSEISGLKRYTFNEMTFLAYYAHAAGRGRLLFFPCLPKNGTSATYLQVHRPVSQEAYVIGGAAVGPPIFDFVFDPGSWGQYLGGSTYQDHTGKPIHGPRSQASTEKFGDAGHIIGYFMTIDQNTCRVRVRCNSLGRAYQRGGRSDSLFRSEPGRCYRVPYVACVGRRPRAGGVRLLEKARWFPLANLHVYSKHIRRFVSAPCTCTDLPLQKTT
jgi:hypothetical protein